MIRAETKRIIRTFYLMRCGYCGVSERDIGAELTYDHFKPQSAGGGDDAPNIVYSCHACNERKGDYWSDDPATHLLHPLNDDLTLHLREEQDGTLTPLTPLGQIYIKQLQLNRPPLVVWRLERILDRQAFAERAMLQRTLDTILARLDSIEERLRRRG